jgi:AraC family transcriptional regulator of adaptative response/methylated-DNA-[protein]-cysteine methyltransferase
MHRNIRYTTAPCPVGHVLLAADGRGICQLRLGASPSALVRDFRRALPGARPATSDDPLRGWCDAVVHHMDARGGRGAPPRLPLELGGTVFQRRVWRQLAGIPAGEVRTYTDVAVAIGSPNAARAVARACATNPVAVLVPCHRVVPKRGGGGRPERREEGRGHGGYRWGSEIKRALLEREAAGAAPRQAAATSR